MIDGSICNVIGGTNSAQTCYICGCTPKDMNKERSERLQSNESAYSFGLSPLHCWIRAFECMLHIFYRLDFKKWQTKGEDFKKLILEKKSKVQKEFKEKLGLNIGKPKPGFGSTNDGNIARRFFF